MFDDDDDPLISEMPNSLPDIIGALMFIAALLLVLRITIFLATGE